MKLDKVTDALGKVAEAAGHFNAIKGLLLSDAESLMPGRMPATHTSISALCTFLSILYLCEAKEVCTGVPGAHPRIHQSICTTVAKYD